MVKDKKIEKIQNIDINTNLKGGAVYSTFSTVTSFLHNNVMFLNNSKFFAGVVMILLNVGSKFIAIQFSKSTEEYMKFSLSKQLLVFAMAWMGTRDIYTALGLTAVFTVLSDHFFNEESSLCIVPPQYRVLHKLIDTNNDNEVNETEIASAIAILEKAKKEKQRKSQKEAFTKFDFHKFDYDNK
jgi:hypothetical protein